MVQTQNERTGNSVLRIENERMQYENLVMREALMKMTCPTCGSSPSGFPDRQSRQRNLQQENHQLKEEASQLTICSFHRFRIINLLTSLRIIIGVFFHYYVVYIDFIILD